MEQKKKGTVTAVLALVIGAVGLCFGLAAMVCYLRYAAEDGGLSGSALNLLSLPFVGAGLLCGIISFVRGKHALQKTALVVSIIDLILCLAGIVIAYCLY